MPVRALKAVTTSRNGMSSFILACKRMDFHYCDWAGSSRGMNEFLSSKLLPTFAASHPNVEMTVSPRPNRHPVIRASYVNGSQKAICVRNLSKHRVLQKAQYLSQHATGLKNHRRAGKNVVDPTAGGGVEGRSVRGVWSPFHTPMQERPGFNGLGKGAGV